MDGGNKSTREVFNNERCQTNVDNKYNAVIN